MRFALGASGPMPPKVGNGFVNRPKPSISVVHANEALAIVDEPFVDGVGAKPRSVFEQTLAQA